MQHASTFTLTINIEGEGFDSLEKRAKEIARILHRAAVYIAKHGAAHEERNLCRTLRDANGHNIGQMETY